MISCNSISVHPSKTHAIRYFPPLIIALIIFSYIIVYLLFSIIQHYVVYDKTIIIAP